MASGFSSRYSRGVQGLVLLEAWGRSLQVARRLGDGPCKWLGGKGMLSYLPMCLLNR